jgi:hypothetical protein
MIPVQFCVRYWVAYGVHGVSCTYIAVFVVVYYFLYLLLVGVDRMNYTCVMTGDYIVRC